jgi:hypothetical protein
MTSRRHVVNLRNESIARNHKLETNRCDYHPDLSRNNSYHHLSISEVLLLDPELQPQGGDVEGGAQVCGGGGGVRSLKTKFCHILMLNPPANMGRKRRLKNLKLGTLFLAF